MPADTFGVVEEVTAVGVELAGQGCGRSNLQEKMEICHQGIHREVLHRE